MIFKSFKFVKDTFLNNNYEEIDKLIVNYIKINDLHQLR